MRVMVTGGAGFIGSALIRLLMQDERYQVLNFDKLTYAGNLSSLDEVAENPRYRFVRADVGDAAAVRDAIREFRPQIIAHLAAESHVDRSLDGPADFIKTNVVGTFVLLQEALDYWRSLEGGTGSSFASITFPPTRYSAASAERAPSRKRRLTTRARLIRPRRRAPIIWSAPGGIATACRFW